ncbi:MAG: PDZ domain-containing protein [Roseiarcus sp.]
MNVSPAVAEELSLNGVREGVGVADVAEGSLAANVGVEKGDVVLEVNGAKIATTHDLKTASGQRTRYWDLMIARGGQTIRSRIAG